MKDYEPGPDYSKALALVGTKICKEWKARGLDPGLRRNREKFSKELDQRLREEMEKNPKIGIIPA